MEKRRNNNERICTVIKSLEKELNQLMTLSEGCDVSTMELLEKSVIVLQVQLMHLHSAIIEAKCSSACEERIRECQEGNTRTRKGSFET